MNELLGLARSAWSERLGWTILHSLWQIAAITAVFAASSLWLRRSSPAPLCAGLPVPASHGRLAAGDLRVVGRCTCANVGRQRRSGPSDAGELAG